MAVWKRKRCHSMAPKACWRRYFMDSRRRSITTQHWHSCPGAERRWRYFDWYGWWRLYVRQIENGSWVSLPFRNYKRHPNFNELHRRAWILYHSLRSRYFFVLGASLQWHGKSRAGEKNQGTWSIVGIIAGSVNQKFFGEAIFVTNQTILLDGSRVIQAIPLRIFEPVYECATNITWDACDYGTFDQSLACTTTQQDCIAVDGTVVHESSRQLRYPTVLASVSVQVSSNRVLDSSSSWAFCFSQLVISNFRTAQRSQRSYEWW